MSFQCMVGFKKIELDILKSVFKNYVSFQKVFKFPFKNLLNQLCSFIGLKITNKNLKLLTFWNHQKVPKQVFSKIYT